MLVAYKNSSRTVSYCPDVRLCFKTYQHDKLDYKVFKSKKAPESNFNGENYF